MDWTTPFIVYRVSPEGKLEEVFHAHDLKKAKYWLTYIAQPWDVLCKTPVHPKHSQGSKQPEYWSHKEKSGQSGMSEDAWKKFAEAHNFHGPFPEEQMKASCDG